MMRKMIICFVDNCGFYLWFFVFKIFFINVVVVNQWIGKYDNLVFI